MHPRHYRLQFISTCFGFGGATNVTWDPSIVCKCSRDQSSAHNSSMVWYEWNGKGAKNRNARTCKRNVAFHDELNANIQTHTVDGVPQTRTPSKSCAIHCNKNVSWSLACTVQDQQVSQELQFTIPSHTRHDTHTHTVSCGEKIDSNEAKKNQIRQSWNQKTKIEKLKNECQKHEIPNGNLCKRTNDSVTFRFICVNSCPFCVAVIIHYSIVDMHSIRSLITPGITVSTSTSTASPQWMLWLFAMAFNGRHCCQRQSIRTTISFVDKVSLANLILSGANSRTRK